MGKTKDDFVARVAVGEPNGLRSAIFRFWSPKGKSDVYAGIRDIAGAIKISLHASGRCFAGLTNHFAEQEPAAIAKIGESRHQSQWTRPTHTGKNIVTPLQFAIPRSELRLWPNGPVDTSVTWIDPPSPSHSTIVSCVFSGKSLSDMEWPGRKNGTQLAGTKLMPNGEKFWLLWQHCATSHLEREILRGARATVATKKVVPFVQRDRHSKPTRTMIFKEFPDSGLLVVLDVAVLDEGDDAPVSCNRNV